MAGDLQSPKPQPSPRPPLPTTPRTPPAAVVPPSPGPPFAGQQRTAPALTPSEFAYYSGWSDPWASYYGAPTSTSLVPTDPTAATTPAATTVSASNSKLGVTTQYLSESLNGHKSDHLRQPARDEYLEAMLALRPSRKHAQMGFVSVMKAIKEYPVLLDHVRLRMRELQLPDPFSTAAMAVGATTSTTTTTTSTTTKDKEIADTDLPLSNLEMAVYLSDPLNYQPPPSKTPASSRTTIATATSSSSSSSPASIAMSQLVHDGSEASLLAAVNQWKSGGEAKAKDMVADGVARAGVGAASSKGGKVTTGNHTTREQRQLNSQQHQDQLQLSSDESEVESEPEQSGGGPKRRRLTRAEAEELVREQQEQRSRSLDHQQQAAATFAPETLWPTPTPSVTTAAATATATGLTVPLPSEHGVVGFSSTELSADPLPEQGKKRRRRWKSKKERNRQPSVEQQQQQTQNSQPLSMDSQNSMTHASQDEGAALSSLPKTIVDSVNVSATGAENCASLPKKESQEESGKSPVSFVPTLTVKTEEENSSVSPAAHTVTVATEHSRVKGNEKVNACKEGEVPTVPVIENGSTLVADNSSSLPAVSAPSTSQTDAQQPLPLTKSAKKRARRKLRIEHGQHRQQELARMAAATKNGEAQDEENKVLEEVEEIIIKDEGEQNPPLSVHPQTQLQQ
ncbi:hypothetical protein BGZ73_000904 [Actinomortierella ambigua]|nr:hypothetical protein BGZ73_000904 [Actinomortierella ambigua]